MKVYNDDVEIMILPDCAKCKLTGNSPLNMEDCPMGFYQDDDDDICLPGDCKYYSEVSDE